ncbi:MAG TPA: phosphoenolpyruvate--protein phosphotransferase [Woeseiaceae bacterium]|nr:phosphoenolpyruvate--protein phosphotransferase [Woeseiaceae bacterium]
MKLVLAAPISGWVVPLDDVPDAAFAGRMVGDGAAIDPTDSVLRAPCDGVVTAIAAAGHAVTLRAESGAEILLHVGIDTVGLQGQGFTRRVEQGAGVRRGDPLLELDLDRLARGAKSLVTPVVVLDAARFPVTLPGKDRLIRAGEPFLEVGGAPRLRDEESATPAEPDAATDVIVHLPHGFHARPAAQIARLSRQFTARVVLSAHGREASAGSTVALMALGVGAGERVELRAFGADAEAAVRTLADGIASGFGEPQAHRKVPASAACGRDRDASPRAAPPAGSARGTVASRGLAIGVAWQLAEQEFAFPEAGGGVAIERTRLDDARGYARERLRQLAATAGDDTGDVLSAQGAFLDDPELLEVADRAIRDGKSAAHAWHSAIRGARELLEGTGDSRLAERAADLRDVEAQVLQALAGEAGAVPDPLPEAAIVLAGELLPSQLARLDLSQVAGFCTAAGGPTSHVALLAASLGIPAVVGAGTAVLEVTSGTPVLLDADTGRLLVDPDEEALSRARGRIKARRARRAQLAERAREDGCTADGRRIRVFANLASVADAGQAIEAGAEGCGLLRTEFLFQDRTAAPPVDEQAAVFQAIADALAPRPLVIRLLDAGGDKALPYLPLPAEANPLLGLRGLRALFRFPELLRDQLAAILQVESAAECRILLPMITEAGEVGRVRALLDELGGRGRPVAVGAMIETPAAAALARSIARTADFLSIGTNDLAQYTLAMDRAHPELAGAFDFFHPAVLHQVAAVCEAAAAAGRDVSVCGALASEPAAAPVLIGLGVQTLSAVPAMIPELKDRIRSLSFAACRDLARDALAQEDAGALRRLVDGFAAPVAKP